MFGSRIQALRRSSHLKQDQLAEKIGVSTSAIGMYEQGRREPSYEVLIKIATYFGVTTDYLIGINDDKPSDEYILGDRIKFLRKRAGLTQSDLAEMLGTIKQTVSNWECNISSPDADTLCALSAIFGVTTDYLLKGVEPEQAEDKKEDASYEAFQVFIALVTDAVESKIAKDLSKSMKEWR